MWIGPIFLLLFCLWKDSNLTVNYKRLCEKYRGSLTDQRFFLVSLWIPSLSGSAWTLCSDMKLPLLIHPLQAPWKSSWASGGLDISHGKLLSRPDSSHTHTTLPVR